MQAERLAELEIHCLAAGTRSATEAAIDGLDALLTAEGGSDLRRHLAEHMLGPLLLNACYPLDFTGWDACLDDDQEAFLRFR